MPYEKVSTRLNVTIRRSSRLTAMAIVTITGLTLAACNSNSISEGLRPQASLSANEVAPQPAADVGSENTASTEQAMAPSAMTNDTARTSPAAQRTQQQVASLPRVSPVAFLPVTGAPQSVVNQLAGAMRSAAKSQSVPVVISVKQGAQYQIKGYFSALGDNSGTTLVYVWDVLDKNGVRVHRISGQEHGAAANGDPWSGIGNGVIDRVARSTMSNLRSWITQKNAG